MLEKQQAAIFSWEPEGVYIMDGLRPGPFCRAQRAAEIGENPSVWKFAIESKALLAWEVAIFVN